jgi:hypothetical protein
MALSQLQHLQEEHSNFFNQSLYTHFSPGVAALRSITDIMNDLTRIQIALSSPDELRTTLFNQVSAGSALSILPVRLDACCLCKKDWEEEDKEEDEEEDEEYFWSSEISILEDTIEDLKQTCAICQEILIREVQFLQWFAAQGGINISLR